MTAPVALTLSVLWWAAALVIVMSVIAILMPFGRLRLVSRRRAALACAFAVAVLALLAWLPPPLTTVTPRVSRLDEIAPAFHYNEVHERHVNAPPERVYAAMKATAARDIALFQTFTTIRRFGRPAPESILNAPETEPILSVATRSGFTLRADEPPRELVVSTTVAPNVTAAMNFRVEPEGTGSRLSTETRVRGADSAAIRPFTPYWRTILPGSWILRVTWLNAIARRAELNELQ
jgi:hypothetical protein